MSLIQSFRRRFRPFLEHPRLPVFVALLGMALAAPSLLGGFQADDILHRGILLGKLDDSPMRPKSRSDLFAFMDGDAERTQAILDYGYFPWWTFTGAHFVFLRSLTVLTHLADYALWPNSPFMMHLQNTIWYGATVLFAALLFRRLFGAGWIAGLAGLFYAIHYGHGMPAGWIANRNGVISVAFGWLALLMHDRWRRDGWKPGVIFAPLALGLGLCSGEAAVSVCGYLFAYALFIDGGRERPALPLRERLISLIPCAVVGLAWAAYYKANGYGAYGSDVYIDPGGEPAKFAKVFIERAPVLFLGQWGLPPADIFAVLSAPVARLFWKYAVAVCAIWIFLFTPLLRRSAAARFLALGMCLALVPAAGTFPSSRLLLSTGFGAAGLAALFIAGLREGADWLPHAAIWRAPARLAAWFLIFLRGAFSPLLFPVMSLSTVGAGILINQANASFPFDTPGLKNKTVVIPMMPNAMLTAWLPVTERGDGASPPARMRVLAPGIFPVGLRRTDERTLVVRPERGYFPWPGDAVSDSSGALLNDARSDPPAHAAYVFAMLDRLARDSKHPLRAGTKIRLTGVEIEILNETLDQRPLEVAFRFDLPLEDSSFLWLQWHRWNYLPFKPPAIGEKMTLEAER